MKNNLSCLDLEKELRRFNKLEEEKEKKRKCNTLLHKLYGSIRHLEYPGVESWRARYDFRYLNKNGYDNLMNCLIKKPVFEYEGNFDESKNFDYWKFLVSNQTEFDSKFYNLFG